MIDNIKDDNVHEWIGDRLKRQSNYSEFDKEEDSLTSKFPKIYILWVSSFSLCAGGDGVEPSYLPHRWKCSKVQIFQQKTLPSFHRRQVRMETRLLKTNKFVTKCYFIQIWCQCKKCNLILPFEITVTHFWRKFLGGENTDIFTCTLHICHNHHNRWLCKKIQSSVKFPMDVIFHKRVNFYTQIVILQT